MAYPPAMRCILAPMGYVLVGKKTRSADRFVLCTGA
jgi:hypothetical protein